MHHYGDGMKVSVVSGDLCFEKVDLWVVSFPDPLFRVGLGTRLIFGWVATAGIDPTMVFATCIDVCSQSAWLPKQ